MVDCPALFRCAVMVELELIWCMAKWGNMEEIQG